MAASVARRKVVERVRARVFGHLETGGNPVTIFSSQSPLKASTQERLAQGCDWESVMVEHRQSGRLPKLDFYMPSGEQVSFCAHAAMGAALEICLSTKADNEDEVSFAVADMKDSDREEEFRTALYDGDIVALQMNTFYEQKSVRQPPMLARALREYCGLSPQDLASTPLVETPEIEANEYKYGGMSPILCHSSIARPKTLIPMRSLGLLHGATAPNDPDGGFARFCEALDDTTGLYLYAKSLEEDGAWECRQFPRASGYPEDPATGIAAAALACYFYAEHDMELPAYKFYQGTKMGKSSLIVVDELVMKQEPKESDIEVSFRLLGTVEIDERDSIEVEEDEDDDDDNN